MAVIIKGANERAAENQVVCEHLQVILRCGAKDELLVRNYP